MYWNKFVFIMYCNKFYRDVLQLLHSFFSLFVQTYSLRDSRAREQNERVQHERLRGLYCFECARESIKQRFRRIKYQYTVYPNHLTKANKHRNQCSLYACQSVPLGMRALCPRRRRGDRRWQACRHGQRRHPPRHLAADRAHLFTFPISSCWEIHPENVPPPTVAAGATCRLRSLSPRHF